MTTAITGNSLRQQVKQHWTHPHVFSELRVTIHWRNACLCFLRLRLGVNINYGAGPTLPSWTAHVPHTSLPSHLWPHLHTKGCLWDIFSRGIPSSHGTWLSNKLASWGSGFCGMVCHSSFSMRVTRQPPESDSSWRKCRFTRRQALYLVTQSGLGPGWLCQDILHVGRVDWEVRATFSIPGSSESCANLVRACWGGQGRAEQNSMF